jgi:hypothetical protein
MELNDTYVKIQWLQICEFHTYRPFDPYKSPEKGSKKSIFQINIFISWCMLIHVITYLCVITSILPISKHRKCHSDNCHRDKTLITRYQASREPHDVTSAHLSIVVWKISTFSEEIFHVGVSEAEPSTDIDHLYPYVWCLCGKLILFFLIQCWNMW